MFTRKVPLKMRMPEKNKLHVPLKWSLNQSNAFAWYISSNAIIFRFTMIAS